MNHRQAPWTLCLAALALSAGCAGSDKSVVRLGHPAGDALEEGPRASGAASHGPPPPAAAEAELASADVRAEGAPAAAGAGEAAAPTTITATVTIEATDEGARPRPEAELPQRQGARPMRLLTAASVSDADRRDNYLGFLQRHPYEGQRLGLDMSRRVRVRVVDGYGRPVHDARVVLVGQGHRIEGRTHADGVWDFYPGISAPQAGGVLEAHVESGSLTAAATLHVPTHGDGQEVVFQLQGTEAAPAPVLDLAFLIDATGSMSDELRYVNAEVTGIVRRIRDEVPEVRVRVGAVFYRDRGDAVPLEHIPMTADVEGFATAMQTVQATGGGDYPEDLNSGLEAALGTLRWTKQAAVRALVLIGDAPPKRYETQYEHRAAMMDASRRGIRIVPVAASGADREVEYLFRAMGAFTSTPYVYLTDDSGIGNPHLEADTDRVAVEYFHDLLIRMIVADLRGEGMHEPGAYGPGSEG